MIRMALNLTLFASGFLSLVGWNFYLAVSMAPDSDIGLCAIMVLAPLILWLEVALYCYVFDGAVLLTSSVVRYARGIELEKERQVIGVKLKVLLYCGMKRVEKKLA